MIVADFENRTSDPGLAGSITEAFRIDLGQSPVVRRLSTAELAAALGRMQRDPAPPLTAALAREIAAREGAKAVFSIPDLGGWIMLTGGILIGLVSAIEGGILNRFLKKNLKPLIWFLPLITLISCSPNGPEPITLHKDNCEFCKMSIAEGNFAAELITQKGMIFKFDDITCLIKYTKENPDKDVKGHYVHYYLGNNELIPAETAHYIKGGTLGSPIAGNIAAFKTEEEANDHIQKLNAEKTEWNTLFKD